MSILARTFAAHPALLGQPEPILARIGLAMGLSLALTVPAYFLDTREFLGENVWIKPIKFQIALTVYLLTLAFFAGLLPKSEGQSPKMRWLWVALTLSTLAEMLWIGGAAMFGTASHYNTHPIMATIYGVMGFLATVLIFGSLVLGVKFWRNKKTNLPEALRLSLALGLILTFVLTLPAAFVLAAMPGHFVGVPEIGATLPIMGWPREVGDLRVAHFWATHALHLVPMIGLLAMTFPNPVPARRFVWAGALGVVGLTVFSFVQALLGQPFL